MCTYSFRFKAETKLGSLSLLSIPGRHPSGHPLLGTWDGNDQKGVSGAGWQPGVEGVHKNQQWAAGSFGQRQQDGTGQPAACSHQTHSPTALHQHFILFLFCFLSCSLSFQEAYVTVVEYFGENPKTMQPSMFFPLFGRFIRAYKVKMCSRLYVYFFVWY